jgi:3-isopropylmalate/(R)-2-methylmalate dehydratase small subunit
MEAICAKAVKFGDEVNTDAILPGKYLPLIDPKELGQHAMEGLDSTFNNKAKEGIILVAGKNFGCGSSREQAPIALKYAGVKCVLAESFARIFYRNAINIGLPIVECKNVSSEVAEDDVLTVNLETGIVKNRSNGKILNGSQLPPFILEIISDGGLVENMRKKVKKK